MEFHHVPVITFLALSTLLVASHAVHVSPQAYWNTVLPNSPMPKAIKTRLPSSEAATAAGLAAEGGFYFSMRRGDVNIQGNRYRYAAMRPSKLDQVQLYLGTGQTVFFLEKNMKQGTVLKLDLAKDVKGATFLPIDVSQTIPFSSGKINDILNRLSIEPNSKEAEFTKQSIRDCEDPGLKGVEQKYCATSLESMVDFSTSKLGKNVRVLSTELSRETPMQEYTIAAEPKKISGRGKEVVVCHLQSYAYAVFFCHNVHSTRAYAVSLEGADGTKGKAVAVCHIDTSAWNPKHLAFQMLKVKPGTASFCHILPEDNILWVPLK